MTKKTTQQPEAETPEKKVAEQMPEAIEVARRLYPRCKVFYYTPDGLVFLEHEKVQATRHAQRAGGNLQTFKTSKYGNS